MLATGLLFGYCSGVVTHLSVRPLIAAGALILAALPAIVSDPSGDLSHRILATMFCFFLVGALQSVLSAHRTAIRRIRLRLDMAALARSDALTGLANRLGLRRAFEGVSATGDASVAIHCFDLDGFKPSTTATATRPGTPCCRNSASGCACSSPRPPWRPGSAGTSSWCSSRGAACRGSGAPRPPHRACPRRTLPARDADRQCRVEPGLCLRARAMADLDDLLREADAASYAVKRRGGGVAAAWEQEERAGTRRA